jgi:hypothetical protein
MIILAIQQKFDKSIPIVSAIPQLIVVGWFVNLRVNSSQ